MSKTIVVSIGQLKRMIAEAMHVSEPDPSAAWSKGPKDDPELDALGTDDEDELEEIDADAEPGESYKSPRMGPGGKMAPAPPKMSNIRKSPVTGKTAPKPPRPFQLRQEVDVDPDDEFPPIDKNDPEDYDFAREERRSDDRMDPWSYSKNKLDWLRRTGHSPR